MYTTGKHVFLKISKKSSFLRWMISAIVILLVIAGIEYIQKLYVSKLLFQHNDDLHDSLTQLHAEIETEINSSIYLINALSTFITLNPQSDKDDWQKISQEILNRESRIRSIGVVRDGIIKFVYPLSNNQALIDFDLRKFPRLWRVVERATHSGKMILSHPETLIDGDEALVACMPIFIGNRNNKNLWGVVGVTINFLPIYEHFREIEQRYKLQLAVLSTENTTSTKTDLAVDKQQQNSSQYQEIIYGNSTAINGHIISYKMHFPATEWHIYVSKNTALTHQWYRHHLMRLIGYPFAILLFYVLYQLLQLYRISYTASMHDELTGLPNRRHFIQQLESAVNAYQQQQKVFTLLNMDINDFKPINDTHGHAIGDDVLKIVASRLKNSVRKADLCARTGGDEFLVLLTSVEDRQIVRQVIEKIKLNIEYELFHIYGITLKVTVSIGYAICPKDAQEICQLLMLADERMYEHKEYLKKVKSPT